MQQYMKDLPAEGREGERWGRQRGQIILNRSSLFANWLFFAFFSILFPTPSSLM